MNKVLILSLAFATLLLASCSEPMREKAKQVRVGMTMEEVEHILGKPESIEPGTKRIKDNYADEGGIDGWIKRVYNDDLSRVSKVLRTALGRQFVNEYFQKMLQKGELARNPNNTFVLLSPDGVDVSVETAGQLLYESWYYPIYDTLSGYAISGLPVIDASHFVEAMPNGHFNGAHEVVPVFKIVGQLEVAFSRSGMRVANVSFAPKLIQNKTEVGTHLLHLKH